MRRKTSVILGVVVAAATALAGCSSSSHSGAPSSTTGPVSTPSTRIAMPNGPEASISGPLTGGKGVSLTSGNSIDLTRAGYTESEYFASGTATSYRYVGTHGTDGRWAVAPKATASYRTRIVVRRPRDSQKFNGTVFVEWLNVTAGFDTPADFSTAATEITRSGYAWVGVSAQQIGVQGGAAVIPVAGLPSGGLRGADPARYGSLHHPGDQYAFDIFSQIGRSLRSPGSTDALSGLRPQRMVAIGESQSAFQLTTYIDAIQQTARIFDGFFVHSRGGGAIPITGGGISTGIVGGVRIRDDIDVPVFLFETETDLDVLSYVNALQPDSKHIRLWEVAGAAHADAYLVGGNANALGCKTEINSAPTHYVAEAALRRLDEWLRTGTAPASAPRLQLVLAKGRVQRDALGNAIGGVRTAANDVPIATLSGDSADSSVLCGLFGSTRPFDHATLQRLYPTKAAYLAAFGRATDKAIANGYLLPADRAAILADAAKANV